MTELQVFSLLLLVLECLRVFIAEMADEHVSLRTVLGALLAKSMSAHEVHCWEGELVATLTANLSITFFEKVFGFTLQSLYLTSLFIYFCEVQFELVGILYNFIYFCSG